MSFAKSAVIVIPIRKVGNFEKQENGDREERESMVHTLIMSRFFFFFIFTMFVKTNGICISVVEPLTKHNRCIAVQYY